MRSFYFFRDAAEAPEGAELFDVAGARLSVAAILEGTLSYRAFFTSRHQLRVPVAEE